ncbi:MAG: hypothetical protein H9W81_07730 [Enterococcus sp.]|nr:hypothetical protein [Enterococcus sp.]
MARTFPHDKIYFKHTDMVAPEDLRVGYFISQYDGWELFEASTTPAHEISFFSYMVGENLLVLNAGEHFDIDTKTARWAVELMSENGNTLSLTGATPIMESDIRVNMSRHQWHD